MHTPAAQLIAQLYQTTNSPQNVRSNVRTPQTQHMAHWQQQQLASYSMRKYQQPESGLWAAAAGDIIQ
jgi:hypothetical protein